MGCSTIPSVPADVWQISFQPILQGRQAFRLQEMVFFLVYLSFLYVFFPLRSMMVLLAPHKVPVMQLPLAVLPGCSSMGMSPVKMLSPGVPCVLARSLVWPCLPAGCTADLCTTTESVCIYLSFPWKTWWKYELSVTICSSAASIWFF